MSIKPKSDPITAKCNVTKKCSSELSRTQMRDCAEGLLICECRTSFVMVQYPNYQRRRRRTALEKFLKMMTTTLVLILLSTTSWPCVQSSYYEGTSSEELSSNRLNGNYSIGSGITPPVLNLATRADIFVNATCGEREPETYCKLVEHVHLARARSSQCQVCDDKAGKGKRHPIRFAIDGSNRWWQSPSLQNGRQYEWVTITIDLKQVYQVAYIIIKAGISSRPGSWILERSLDGIVYMPWQYYAISDEECWTRYRIRAKPGKPHYEDDEEIICTSYYSSLYPMEGGEIHTSLVNGRPGADGPSERLTKFTMARFVRLRLQKIRTLHGDLMNVGGPERSLDKSVTRRYFYSIKDISIGGHCVCFGHADSCIFDQSSQVEKCSCQHNTCGERCDVCCPLFNQQPWGAGNSTTKTTCEPCECHGQSEACIFDPLIASQKLSINTHGVMDGGGVCLDCKAHTTGINCERCEEGFFRPRGVAKNDPRPCLQCQCDARGSDGTCVPDETAAQLLRMEPGDCICKTGYTGKFCDQCEMGFRAFPNCNPCPCHLPGITNMECEGDCICKGNVQGKLCTECKKGFYNLIKENPRGCTQCFCHAVTDKCTASNFAITRVIDHDNWFVTDLHGTKVIALTPTNGVYHIANEEFTSFSMYYWGNAKAFSGSRVLSYGLQMTFHTSWIHARGDTSGKPVMEYDLIIQSTNNMLAFSNRFHEGNNATVHVTLNEIDCVVLPDIDNNIIQRTPTPALGTPCTRLDVMEGTHDVKRLLVRAKYHTDQIEGSLGYAFLEKADINLIAGPGEKAATSVEVCSCPVGYSGTSCQDCAYGYRKSNSDAWLNVCIKCDCNGHSPSCDADGKKCLSCEHDTTGDQCQFCRDGFYGNASSETQFSCKPCECPLSVHTNNFSPTCQMSGNSYECTACPDGYEGPFCERCANGYYGNPNQPGDYCKSCDCNLDGGDSSSLGNICDHLTGECLVCPRNTIGWNCDECLPGHYGNPLNGSCSPCRCDETGSVSITSCHPDTGQCPCQDAFTGRRCNECTKGHGNRDEGCASCGCNPIGSRSLDGCDPVSGQCDCKPGIGGRFCNKCLDLHFGFSNNGCLSCNCHTQGSDSPLCDLNTGQCHCLPNVRGRKCETCAPGHWNVNCGTGCVRCDCDPVGSLDGNCDIETGRCLCKPGVGGAKCNKCLDNCFGFSANGCRPCDPCVTPGHVCDSYDGRCGCPINVEGDLCNKCTVGFWGNPRYGCKPCNCSQQGSTTPQCSPESGRCNCALGYEGDKCNKCKFGYFNYPQCTPCTCEPHGTDDRFCNNEGICSCADNGQCHCKDNVIGAKCDQCRDGTYGLEPDNPDGCMECFCFHRTSKCSQGYFKWQRLALPSDRHVVPSANSENQLKLVNNLIVIPDQANDIIIEKDISFSAPLYWQLPHIFLGDKVLSYNGYIRFRTDSIGGSNVLFPPRVLASYPLVQIQRYPSLILEHYVTEFDPIGYHEVRLHEDDWRLKNGPYNGVVTKETMMVALQNLHHVLIRGTHSPEVSNATLFNVSLDIAIPSPNGDKSMAHGIEVCECPPQYNSTSCQNPRIGFYRWYKRDYVTSTVIIDLVGEARPCECNGRSNTCDTESGFCANCSENTGGRHCEQCAVGYYGDPFHKCQPCPCPSIWNNHAESCYLPPNSEQFECFCRPGYTGKSCERCDYGFYGRPWETGGRCRNCNCNEHGSVSDECHEVTGQCNCRAGVSGRDCSKCADRHVIVGQSCTSCDDSCTGKLLNQLHEMSNDVKDVYIDQQAVSAIKRLMSVDNVTKIMQDQINNKIITKAFIDDIPTHETLGGLMLGRAGEQEEQCGSGLVDAHASKRKGQDLLNRVELIRSEIRRHIGQVEDFAQGKIKGPDPSEVVDEMSAILQTLNNTSEIIQEISDLQDDELEAVNDLMEAVLVKVFNSTVASLLQNKISDVRQNLDDLMQYISQADKDSDEAARIVILAREFLDTGRINVNTIDDLTIEMETSSVMTTTTLGDTGYAKTELEQVLLMLEDIIGDFRNSTKELEILETNLFESVPLFRVTYAQPAFDHVKGLEQQAQYVEGLLVQLNGSESVEAVTAYQRIKEGFDKAFELANDAKAFAAEATEKVNELLSTHSSEVLLMYSADMIKEGLELSGIVENSMRNNISSCNSAIDSLKWRMKIANDSFLNMNIKIDELGESINLDELLLRIQEIFDTVNEVGMGVMEIEDKIQRELLSRINAVGIGSSLGSVDAPVLVSTTEHRLRELKSETIRTERLNKDFETRVVDTADDKMKYLKALIKQARHKANTVGVSIGPDETGTCFRLFKWPVIDSTTSIKFNFAPTKFSDSLLFYWPSSITGDFISIEMVSGQIKASWELGSGLRTLIHPVKLSDVSENSIDPDFWVQIHLERVGSFVTLDVKTVSMSDNSILIVPLPSATSIRYSNYDEEMTLMNLSPNDLIHIGGMSILKRDGLVTNGLSGCIHNLQVNQQSIGLWNFVGSEGCAPCVECPVTDVESSSGDLDYYFDGRGYSVVNRVQSKTFNSRFFDVSVEFRTLSENGLIFLTVNDTVGQMISLEINRGKLVLQVRHKWNDGDSSLRIESNSDEGFNHGKWVNVRAVWVYQKGMQIGKLMIGNKDFTQEKKSPALSLELLSAAYHIGGVSPIFDPAKWKDLMNIVPYVGCMKNILINNSPYDPLSGTYYGVESPCTGKAVYKTSFEGDGFAEFASQPMDKNFKFGFSFKTLSPTGLLVLSTSMKSTSVEDNYYAVFLENGEIKVQIGTPHGVVDLVANSTRYDDGKYHAVRLIKKNRKLILYTDDEEIMESRLPKTVSIIAASTSRGLFLGGTSAEIQNQFQNSALTVTRGFTGCLLNFYFDNQLLRFNFPISHKNHNLGQCHKHHEYDPKSVPTHFLYPNTIGTLGINKYDIVPRVVEESCSAHEHVIQQEDPVKALKFGDSPNSYVTLSLDGNKHLRQRFNLTFSFRTYYPNGLLFQGLKKKGNGQCLMTYLKDGQIIVKLYGERSQDLVSPLTSLNDGMWHQISLVKAEEKMYLYVDNRDATQTQVPKIKTISKLNLGGIPLNGQDCLANSLHKPEQFKGCLKNLVVNSHLINFETSHATLNEVNPCFKSVERGTFFRAGSYAIFTYNLTLGTTMELEMEFRSDSQNGLLLSFIPSKSTRFPTFSIFLENGKIIARETTSSEDYYEAVSDFGESDSVCDGRWHSLKANYEKGSITLRVDGQSAIYAVATEPTRSPYNGNAVVGSLFIGGVEEGASRLTKKLQFHGCIRNISVNQERKDWTDMPFLSQVYLNSCPA